MGSIEARQIGQATTRQCIVDAARERFILLRIAEIKSTPHELTKAVVAYGTTHPHKTGMILMHLGCENDILRRASCAELSDLIEKSAEEAAINEWLEA